MENEKAPRNPVTDKIPPKNGRRTGLKVSKEPGENRIGTTSRGSVLTKNTQRSALQQKKKKKNGKA